MEGCVRELITLQVGHYANFIGTHWWNLQEAGFVYDNSSTTDINHDYLFREGITLQRQETYTPRLISIDFKGNLHSLPESGSLYNQLRPEPATSEASWDGPIQLIRQLPEEKNEFLRDLEQEDALHIMQTDEDKDICSDDTNTDSKVSSSTSSLQKLYDLQNSVNVWSDYLRPHLHPNSLYLLEDKDLATGSANEEGSWGFPTGSSLWHREEVEDGITDRIRIFAESCGSLQGFQIISDIHDGMGGLCSGILAHLEDEFGSKDSIVFAVTSPHLSHQVQQSKLLIQANIIQSYTLLSKLSSMFVPLNLRQHCLDFQSPWITFPHISQQIDSAYMSSSVLASFLDTATLPYRLRMSPLPLRHVTDLLALPGREVVGGTLSMPIGLNNNQYLMEWLKNGNYPKMVPVSADIDTRVDAYSELRSIRGIPSSQLVGPDTKLPPGRHYTNAWQLYHDYLQESRLPLNKRLVVGARDPLKTTAPFPSIFNDAVTDDGFIDLCNTSRSKGIVNTMPCVAGLHQGGGIGYLLQELLSTAEKLDVSKVPRLLEEGMDREAWMDVKEQLQRLNGNYIPKNRFDRSSSDDD